MASINHDKYRAFLCAQVKRYMPIVEQWFGTRNPRFMFGTVCKAPHDDDFPSLNFPISHPRSDSHNGIFVNIHISSIPWEKHDRDWGTWQVSHECVHLLDPIPRESSTFLEEGLAVWFQSTLCIDNHVNDRKYKEAHWLVIQCMPQIADIVMSLRETGVAISEISFDHLRNKDRMAHIEDDLIRCLCASFN